MDTAGRDAGFIAHQCPQGGMHITAEDIIVEIVDQQGNPVPDGSAGEIVVTHLQRQTFLSFAIELVMSRYFQMMRVDVDGDCH